MVAKMRQLLPEEDVAVQEPQEPRGNVQVAAAEADAGLTKLVESIESPPLNTIYDHHLREASAAAFGGLSSLFAVPYDASGSSSLVDEASTHRRLDLG